MTAKQYLKANPEKFFLVTYEFGTPVYISEPTTKGIFDIGITPNKAEAIQWTTMDNTPTKLGWYAAKTGYKNLTWEQISNN